ncbi:MAG: orc1/cdc6 family replication initiation protein [Phycisphaerae bacterium]|nr:orc1/cdc6 family replication initiation protein [Phycisphaerae bacterium]
MKDFSVFDFHNIPDEPVMREEVTTLIDELLRFDLSGIPTHLAIIGSRGSGKTLMVKYLQRVIPESVDLEILYANCRHHNTSFKIVAHLLGIQARGASMSEAFERFCARHQKKTVVVLDEIDLMSTKDRRREILYLLSRSAQPFMAIMLSNSPQVLKELDAATRSSLQPVPLHSRNYNAQQIQEILLDRARRGLRSWGTGALGEIAALTTRLTNSDARLAIKTLQYSATSPGKDLRGCFERARRDLVIDLINDLSDPTLTILWAAAASRTDFAKDIYRRYCRLSCQQKEKPFSYVYFYSNLSYLQSVGLVALVSTKQGRTYTNRVLLTFDSAAVREICSLRFDA